MHNFQILLFQVQEKEKLGWNCSFNTIFDDIFVCIWCKCLQITETQSHCNSRFFLLLIQSCKTGTYGGHAAEINTSTRLLLVLVRRSEVACTVWNSLVRGSQSILVTLMNSVWHSYVLRVVSVNNDVASHVRVPNGVQTLVAEVSMVQNKWVKFKHWRIFSVS